MRLTKSVFVAVIVAVIAVFAAAAGSAAANTAVMADDLQSFEKDNPQGYVNFCSSTAAFYQQKADFAKALTWTDRILQAQPQNIQALLYKSQLLFSLDRYEECEKILEAFEASPQLKDSPVLVGLRGLLYKSYKASKKLADKEKELEAELKAEEIASSRDTKPPGGVIASDVEAKPEQIPSLRGAAEPRRSNLDTYRQLFMMYRTSESYDKTIKLAEKAIGAHPAESSFKFALAYACDRKDKIDAAIGEYKTIIAAYPDNLNAYNLLFIMLKEKKRLNDARALWGDFIKSDPNNAYRRFQLVDILYNMDKLDEADAELNAIGQLYPANPQFLAQINGYRNWIAEAKNKAAGKSAGKKPAAGIEKKPSETGAAKPSSSAASKGKKKGLWSW